VNTSGFSLRGGNPYGMSEKKIVYENEEFNLLQAALDIEMIWRTCVTIILLLQLMPMLMECTFDYC
jgi:hypothetical protein